MHLPAVQITFELFELFEHDLLYLFRLADDLNELRQHDVNVRDFFPDALMGDLDLRTVAVVEGHGPLKLADKRCLLSYSVPKSHCISLLTGDF